MQKATVDNITEFLEAMHSEFGSGSIVVMNRCFWAKLDGQEYHVDNVQYIGLGEEGLPLVIGENEDFVVNLDGSIVNE